MQSINSNTQSLNTQNSLNKNDKATKSSLQKLSSGKRINSAKDDAAGLAIALKFATQISGSRQAARNANDAISLVQTAEGGLSEASENLQRMRELAVQSANGTNTASDRQALQIEFSQSQEEITLTVKSTEFNGNEVLHSSQNLEIQVGANGTSSSKLTVTTNNVLSDPALKDALQNIDISSQGNSDTAIGKIDAAIEQISLERSRLGATQNSLVSTVKNIETYHENTSSARSQIIDTDFAKQTAELTKAKIKNNAGLAALSHGNISATLVSGLLNKKF